MDAGLERKIFSIGEPVVVVTNRPVRGYVTGIGDLPHVGTIDLVPQNLQGQKGWVFAQSRPASGGDPTAYEVVFRLEGFLRTVVIDQRTENATGLSEECQLDRGRGHIWEVTSEDLAPDPTPGGTFDGLMDEMDEAGEFDLEQTDVLFLAEELLDAREAGLQPEAYLARLRGTYPQLPEKWLQEHLALGQERWQHFQEEGGSSVHGYVAAYIAHQDAGRLDWTPILAAIEQAEQGDRSTFAALVGDMYEPGGTGYPAPGVPTTACFDCDAIVPVAGAWVSEGGLALCESCFLKREAKGHARRRRKPFPRAQG